MNNLLGFIARHPGTTFVLVGVVGEGLELWAKWKFKGLPHKLERRLEVFGFAAWALVVLGLAWEMKEAAEQDREVARLELQSEQLHSNNLVLDMQLTQLKLQIQPRQLTAQQRQKLKQMLPKPPDEKVIIGYAQNDSEAQIFAANLREVFVDTGYSMENCQSQLRLIPGDASGVWINAHSNPFPPNVAQVVTALISAGVSTKAGIEGAVIGPNDHPELNTNFVIWVGPKPIMR